MALKVSIESQHLCVSPTDTNLYSPSPGRSLPSKLWCGRSCLELGMREWRVGRKRTPLCCQVLLGENSEGNVSDQLLHSWRELGPCFSQKKKQWPGCNSVYGGRKAKGCSTLFLSASDPLVGTQWFLSFHSKTVETGSAFLICCFCVRHKTNLLNIFAMKTLNKQKGSFLESPSIEVLSQNFVTSLLGEFTDSKLHLCSYVDKSGCCSCIISQVRLWEVCSSHVHFPLSAEPSPAQRESINNRHLSLSENCSSLVPTSGRSTWGWGGT